MRGRGVGRCHWRGCVLPRVHDELCEQHKKAADYHGSIVKNPVIEKDAWDGHESWLNGQSWEPFA